MPLISVLIPAKGRPNYTRDAVFSAMRQNFDDFDVTLSNNGADPAVKVAVAEFMGDPRFHYIEQPSVLEMSSHWDIANRAVTGNYLLVLTNRFVFKQGVLRGLWNFLRTGPSNVDIITWGWDSYDNTRRLLLPYQSNTEGMIRLKTLDVLLSFARGSISIMRRADILPLGLNSCVSRALVNRIRSRESHVFQNIAPDYNFAFSCLLNAAELIHINESRLISQGMEDSHGANALVGSFQSHMDRLGLTAPWAEVPIKAALVYNAIAQDFLAALRRYDRSDIRAAWDKPKYYKDCLMEIQMKRNAGSLPTSEIDELERAVELALRNEDGNVRAAVARPIIRKIPSKIKSLAGGLVPSGKDIFRSRPRRLAGERTFRTALEAAGFEC